MVVIHHWYFVNKIDSNKYLSKKNYIKERLSQQYINLPNTRNYEPVHDTIGLGRRIESTEWFPITGTVNAQTLDIKLDFTHPKMTFNDCDALVLTVAVEFGMYDDFWKQEAVNGSGAGKVLG